MPMLRLYFIDIQTVFGDSILTYLPNYNVVYPYNFLHPLVLMLILSLLLNLSFYNLLVQ